MLKCKICEKEFVSIPAFGGHMSSHSRGENYKNKRQTEKSKLKNKKLIKECTFCNKIFENGLKLGGHINNCEKNPDRIKIRNKIKNSKIGSSINTLTKKKISDSMKNAHKEGRAWNIGKSRCNNNPSYPEQFFIKVIENEFLDKNYKREHPFGIYSLDFAWLHKKKVIEIDGEQHERFEEYKNRDIRKDRFLKENDWNILRIKWKDMFNDPKKYIRLSLEFIG
jgi:very-short-patch-repair endonuclease